MIVRLIEESAISSAEDAAIRELLCVCFPPDAAVFSQTRAWNGSAPAFSAVAEEDGRIIAHLGVVDRTITVAGAPFRAAGIQNVAVHPLHRGQKLTAQLMAPAMRRAAEKNFDLGLLFCIPALEAMYARFGWIKLPDPQVTRIHLGKESPLPAGHSTLFHPLARATFPPGPIHLQGDDW